MPRLFWRASPLSDSVRTYSKSPVKSGAFLLPSLTLCYDGGMKEIRQTYEIKAPRSKVWWALTTAEAAEQWGAGPATMDARSGGEFSYWDGDIHGINTRVEPESLLAQDWYGHDDPTQKFNVTFTLEEQSGATLVHLLYVGDIKDEQKDIKDWQEYYFTPIKELLEA